MEERGRKKQNEREIWRGRERYSITYFSEEFKINKNECVAFGISNEIEVINFFCHRNRIKKRREEIYSQKTTSDLQIVKNE